MQSTRTNLIHSLKTHCFDCVKQLCRLQVIFYLREFCSLDTNSIESLMSQSNWCHKNVWIYYYLILVIVDYYMKMTRYLFIKKTLTVVKLTELFFKKIALRYEISNDIIINKNSLFINAFWSKICYHVKVKWWLSIIFHSQTNNLTEWQNQTLKHYLQIYCSEKQDDWTTLLLVVEFMYHQIKHFLLSCSLFKVMYDYESIFDIHIENDAMKEEVSAAKKWVEMLQDMQNTLTQWW